ncbi:hypothetical protein PS467_32410 [Streptomyces luomodiensis]|uniref:Uncharacterized protein n=1 Tax=Streptomyces luomodiensis TaxID=3026192 RepID=A0ABY9VAG5_9ACTN|nr:hypothetical protein [Streptomyces sp. SCA4-21]WNE99700.1 hypothetical protein PS467_32410 [Streptomyces sp. SCA4-21]
MDVIVMVEGDTPTRLAREHRYRELVEDANWSDEKQPSAALANARTVYHDPAVRGVREVWNG